MSLSYKQKQILAAFYKHKRLTKKELADMFGHWYYYNESKHLGDVLSRMVKRRLIHRVKKGTYHIGRGVHHRDNEETKQLNLFKEN